MGAEGQRRVVVVGAGAAGVLAALHLVVEATRRCTSLDVTLVDPADGYGRGVAYGTSDAVHLLNVPTLGMSAYPDDPSHYLRWRFNPYPPDAAEGYAFTARRDYARYLDDTLREAVATSAPDVAVHHTCCRATAIDVEGTEIRVRTDDDRTLPADVIVVASGLPRSRVDWAPEALRESRFFVADPWSPKALDPVRNDEGGPGDVLLVGTGLTMVDVALVATGHGTRSDRVVHAISRTGLLPRPHASTPLSPEEPDISDWGHTLAELRERVAAHLEGARQRTGDWRTGLDGLRRHTATLWGRLDETDRLEFLRRDVRQWNVIRHRIAPESADALAKLTRRGRLQVGRATVEEVTPLPNEIPGLKVRLSDGSIHDVGWVVNCTGPATDIRESDDPFMDDLLRPRAGGSLAVVSTAGMGVKTRDGRLVSGVGDASAPIWTLGALRRGELWESTAIPEIRTQAAGLASDIVTFLASSEAVV